MLNFSGSNDGSTAELIRQAAAEIIGTAILMIIGCGGVIGSLGNPANYYGISLGFGFAVTTAILVRNLKFIS